MNVQQVDIVIIGAGLTGLTAGFYLTRRNKKVLLIEAQNRTGGQIHTFEKDGFVYESGPNTGVISNPEVAELFEALAEGCRLEVAHEGAKRRLIWKGKRFHDLPSGPIGGLFTPLFSFTDKFRILGEPWRKKGTDPNESIGSLAARRLGKSFVDYAVDPFLSGVYAGDPMNLTTRYALPKLYRLEQDYGSFIKGSIAKAKQPKSARDLKATKQVFSVTGGLSRLTEALEKAIGIDRFLLNAQHTTVMPQANGSWLVTTQNPEGEQTVEAKQVLTTTGAYTLPALLPFIDKQEMDKISSLCYAPVIQVSVGIKSTDQTLYNAFGGLVPSCEKRNVLGILYPSACFSQRTPANSVLFSFFIGGVKHADMLQKSDEEIRELVRKECAHMLQLPQGSDIRLIEIFRHTHAIPQYRQDSGDRLATIDALEKKYPGLTLAGNLKDGIGMADRIRQGSILGNSL